MISRFRASCASRVGRLMKAQRASSTKSECVFLCCLAHLSTALNNSCGSMMDVLTFMPSICFGIGILSTLYTNGNSVQSRRSWRGHLALALFLCRPMDARALAPSPRQSPNEGGQPCHWHKAQNAGCQVVLSPSSISFSPSLDYDGSQEQRRPRPYLR